MRERFWSKYTDIIICVAVLNHLQILSRANLKHKRAKGIMFFLDECIRNWMILDKIEARLKRAKKHI